VPYGSQFKQFVSCTQFIHKVSERELSGKCLHTMHWSSCRLTEAHLPQFGFGIGKTVHTLCPDYEQELSLQLLVHTFNIEERLHT
jgi:hypothetical protein